MHPSLAPAIDYVEKGYDADLGLVRMGVRDYDATLGRFTTPDPLFLEDLKRCADSPVECNLYSYAAGNPLLFVDPSGLAIDFWSREFWQGVAFGTYQAGLPGAILVPSPNPDSPEFEAGRAVGLGATSTTQGVVGTLKLLGGGGLVAGGVAGAEAGGLSLAAVPAGVAMCAEGVGTLSIAGVNGVAAVKAWQHAMAMDAQRSGGAQDHHIATDKNNVSTARGGPWTPRFKVLFDRAGVSMNDEANRVLLLDHAGPHPEAYHQKVLERLEQALEGRSGAAAAKALRGELAKMGDELQTPGSELLNLLNGK